MDNISIEELKHHPWYSKYIIGFITLSGYYGGLVGLTWTNYQNSIGFPDCNPVTGPLTEKYIATIDGVWEGQPGFLFSISIYHFKFNNSVNFSNPKY